MLMQKALHCHPFELATEFTVLNTSEISPFKSIKENELVKVIINTPPHQPTLTLKNKQLMLNTPLLHFILYSKLYIYRSVFILEMKKLRLQKMLRDEN